MLEVFLDSVFDTLKALPFLFGAYLLLELLEHRASGKLVSALRGPFGPVGGAVLGCVPQCGFSVAAANFYAGRLISPGTLLAVFLATSDEAVPILLSHPGAMPDLLRLLGIKLLAATLFGLLTDLVCHHFLKLFQEPPFHELCEECGCEERGVFWAALHHTGKVILLLFLINLALSYVIYFIGEEALSRFLLSGSILQPFLAALLGFIPNCAASVLLTELYLAGSLSFGSAMAGLCTGAGLGLIVLFQANRRLKENLTLAGALYAAAVFTGLLCDLLFARLS